MKYTDIRVSSDVRIMSDGHYWFHVYYTTPSGKGVKRSYSYEIGFDGLPPYPGTWEHAPIYLVRETERQIAAKLWDGSFKFYEHDQNGDPRYTDLRYRDADYEAWLLERLEENGQTK